MKVTPYLTSAGKCAEAMTYYESALGGKLSMVMNFADMMGKGTPEGLGDKMAQMTLELSDGTSCSHLTCLRSWSIRALRASR